MQTHAHPGPDLDIRIEQVRLVFQSMKSSLLLGTALALVLLFALNNPDNQPWMLGWFTFVTLSRIVCVGHAWLALRRGVTAHNVSRLTLQMCAIKIIEGLAWGSLSLIVMGKASLPEQLLTMAALAGVSSNAVSLLAPVLPLYLCMQLAQLFAINSSLLLIEDNEYSLLAIGCTLYVIGQIGQARLVQKTSQRSIALRFENLDLVERLRLESERAEEARIKAENANLAKSKFLAAASHDLRQPVHAQELFLEVLAGSELTDMQRKTLGNARAAGLASAGMLNALLDFSRVEAGVVEPKPCAFHLQPLLHKLENEFGSQADMKGIVYRSRETRLAVYSDPMLLELILRNLISNAIRYTTTGGVLIAARKRSEGISIEVVDTGVGITPEQQKDIFREFYQVGNPERDRLKGLGLGLAITDGLIRSLGHDLSVISQPGRGSVFRVHLPSAKPHDFSNNPADAFVTMPLRFTSLNGLRVLVIEDDASVRQGMTELLGSWGCDCRVVEDVEDALALVNQWAVQFIISDYRLRSNLSGDRAIERVRETVKNVVPALIITGDTAPSRLREAYECGIPLLHKPVSPTQLHRILNLSIEG